jgi:excisionase family DNA binding protein
VTTSEPLWTVQKLADYLGVPVQTIYQWRKRGYGPQGRRMGMHLRYRPSDVERWIDSLGTRIA